MFAPWEKSYDQPRQHIKNQSHYFANKCPSSQSYGFSSGHVWMWGLNYKESWMAKNDAFELLCWRRLLRIPWTARRSNHSILKEIKPEYTLEGSNMKIQFIGKDRDAGKDWRQEEKGTTEDEMVGWHHRLDGGEFEWALWDSEGQGSLVCYGSQAHRESNATVTEQRQGSLLYGFHFAVCAFGVVYKSRCLKLCSQVFLLGHSLS